MELTVNICAKINLSLNILGILDNGYHDVDTVMQSVSLYDTLTVRPAPVLTVDCPGVPQEQNTAYKAARLFFAESGIPGGAEVTIKKGIPFASGMGGSSADAAGLLIALNHMYDAPLSHQALLHIGARIGADVCFLMEGGAMRCQGIGEQLTPVINRWDPVYLAVRADGFVTAGQAYHQFDTLGGASCDTDAVLAALAAGDGNAFFARTANALEDGCSRLAPDIAHVLCLLRSSTGCQGAFMTGSGSVCIGVFPDETAARQAIPAFGERFTAVLHNTARGVIFR